ncbi:MAG: hypothetical protein H6744_01740 [Deltaproteobacteria bacterium]|nr:hypothetical protein [Deltaproteobacteria bacterium]
MTTPPGGEATPRRSAPRIELLRRTAGSPRELAGKLLRLGHTLARFGSGEPRRRLARLEAIGAIERAPTRVQLLAGSADMLRFWISPAAADYYRQQGIGYGFHQVLRVLDDPSSMVDPVGLAVDRDTIIGHLLQVVHANPTYDLQLLDSLEDGIDELERQTRAMLDGTHPRARSIGAIVEDPGYHARLLEFVHAYRADPHAAPPIRDNVAANPSLQRIERTFGTLPAAMRYFTRLPEGPLAAARHLLTVRAFPEHLAD